MGSYNIDDKERSKWTQYDEDTEVRITLLTKQALKEISKKAAKRAKLTGEDQADIADRLVGRAAVTGWRKIAEHTHPGLIVNGSPLPFTQENIDLLMTKSLKFSRFVNEMCIDESEFSGGLDESKNG